MSKSIFTQKALAETFKELLLEMPLEKISVKDIASKCGISRNAYYYYYKDKFELMWWIVEYEFEEVLKVNDESKTIADVYRDIIVHLHKNKKFYLPCMQYDGQNSLYDFYQEYFATLTEKKLEYLEKDYPSLAHNQIIPRGVYSRLIAYFIIQSIRDWQKLGNMNNSYETYMDSVLHHINMLCHAYINQTSIL